MKIAISIHAPPRGATYDDGTRVLKSYLFQFTPLREGRLLFTMCIISPVYFNSRPSARGDLTDVQRHVIETISIHAPPRGATWGGGRIPTLYAHFNSRPSARGDAAHIE